MKERERLAAAGCVVLIVAGCGFPWNRSAPHQAARPKRTPAAVGAQFTLDGSPTSGSVTLTARSLLGVKFTAQVPPAEVTVTVNGTPLPTDSLAWSPDLLSFAVPLTGFVPYQPEQLTVVAPLPVTAPRPLQATMLATVPANSTTGVQVGFRPQTPIEIAVENSGPARPQSGLQNADVVYEYLSEYSVTRMTAIYFAGIPPVIGPVRSCRMINPYLAFAYTGLTICSGVSDGTGGYLAGTTPGSVAVPRVTESTEGGVDFYRDGSRAAPHNLYTTGDRAAAAGREFPQPAGAYAVDPPHPDVLDGAPAAWPQVPLHGVTYAYDVGSLQYLRYNDGAPFVDQVTGQQLRAKNVVVMYVPFHDAGWVEDDNGGAHSVWYDMTGSGPAWVYSDGLLVHATWHMGSPGQPYFDNHTPVWFTDETGQVMRLNTGLTWIHVLGNGQDRCPRSPSDCG
jgi:hypothetical protein